MLRIMRDPNTDVHRRDAMAKAPAPYLLLRWPRPRSSTPMQMERRWLRNWSQADYVNAVAAAAKG
jgi:hypothetical protein